MMAEMSSGKSIHVTRGRHPLQHTIHVGRECHKFSQYDRDIVLMVGGPGLYKPL